jgi:four helix bundle protein
MLNIAEGSGKFSNKDRRNFYVTARGSTFECASIVSFLHDEGEILIELQDELRSLYDEISRMLFTMIKNPSK